MAFDQIDPGQDESPHPPTVARELEAAESQEILIPDDSTEYGRPKSGKVSAPLHRTSGKLGSTSVPKSGEPIVCLKNIVKDYKSHRALNSVSFNIGPGVTGLLGPNGAGKSTLIKVLLGLVKVTSGEGQVLGNDIWTEGRSIRELVGYMPEDDCYLAGLSGVEVVRFAACLSGLPATEGLRRAHEILDYSGAEQERYRDVETYSTGMRQKVKFAQALVHDPSLLILDEPTSSLDPEEREAMLARIRNLATQHGKTVIISTHILPDVQSVCDHVIILSEGNMKLSQPLDELMRPASPGLTIQTSRQADPLIAALRSHAAVISSISETTFLIENASIDDVDELWKTADETDVGILSITPMKNSLETVFMDAVREVNHANP